MDVLPAGHQIGSYRIERVAGRGAVGVVYEATSTFTGKRVAIKTMNRVFAGEQEFRARFDREAEGGAAVDHPNITKVLDSGEQDGVPYLVMTFVDGPDLERILEQRAGPLDTAEAVLICRAVAEALDAAAQKGLAHRDVKPANILLAGWDEAGKGKLRPHVYLTDFGLTKHNAAATVTRTGQFVGTLLYMAPEQIEGKAVAASDQYSLACLLWECIVGTPPFLPSGGSNLSLLTAHLSDPIPQISERSEGRVPAKADPVFARAMAKKAGDRYPSCTAFMDDVAAALDLAGDSDTTGSGDGDAEPKSSGGETTVLSPEVLRRSRRARDPDTPSSPEADTPQATPPQPSSATQRPDPPRSEPAAAPPAEPSPQREQVPSAQPTPPPGPQPQPQQGPYAGPPGLPPGLPADAYRRGGGGQRSRRGLWIGLAVLLVVVIVGVAIALATSGSNGSTSVDTSPGDDPVAEDAEPEALGDEEAATADPAQPVTDAEEAPELEPEAAPTTEDDDTSQFAGLPPADQGLIAFVGDGAVWVSAADGSDARSLLELVGPTDGQPAWRPGSQELAVSVEGRLLLLDVATGATEPITDGPGHTDPVWVGADELVVSVPDDLGGRDLATVTLDGAVTPLGLSAQIDSGAASVLNRPAISPVDGTLAFHVNQPDGIEIWMVPPDGSPQRAAGVPGANDFHPAWTGDGELVYSSDRTGEDHILIAPPAGQDRVLVQPRPGVDSKDADVSPCGDWIVFQVDGSAEGSRLAVASISGGGDPQPVPVPEGLGAMIDPGWSGQACA